MATPSEPVSDIHLPTYAWSVRAFNVLRKVLSVNLRLHHGGHLVNEGEIFLFNHFARLETFIPQYLIYQETGALCRSVAASEFFNGDDAFSNYLRRVGAVPHDRPDLLAFLAREVLCGRKVIVFPEGGMVKDRRVLGEDGNYSVYSRTAMGRRKHHTGAAVLGLAVEAYKTAVRRAREAGHLSRIEAWAEALGMEGPDTLLAAAARPTLIVPANITFYPIRVRDNLLRKGAELFTRGMSRRHSEELLIEGNILLRDTDMDIRLAPAVRLASCWRWWERPLLHRVLERVGGVEELLDLHPRRGLWDERLLARVVRRNAARIRDAYMHRIYVSVTVNLSHLASLIILDLVDSSRSRVGAEEFHRVLYLAVKQAQQEPTLHLHRSLRNPEAYAALPDGCCPGLEQFVRTTSKMGLVTRDNGQYRFMPKLRAEHDFDEIRLENLIEVYANEIAPLPVATDAVKRAISKAPGLPARAFANLRFDDEIMAYRWDREYYRRPRYAEINDLETATQSGEPFLLLPDEPRHLGALLIHGFLASPAEMRQIADRLMGLGYPVLAVRLKGHGTSPHDLRERDWTDWLESVRTGYEILLAHAGEVCMVGFSTGGALALRLAAERPAGLAGVVAASVPVKFQDRGMRLVPMVHGANRLVKLVSTREGIKPFQSHVSEHPEINYAHMPIHGLNQLRVLVDELDATLGDVVCPVALIQGTADPVVVPESVKLLRDRLVAAPTSVTWIETNRHGIVYEDVGETRSTIVEFVVALETSVTPAQPAVASAPSTSP